MEYRYKAFLKLLKYCESKKFIGWDPYDGLNSLLFQYSPLKNFSFFRLVWIQIFKRSPINFRKIFLVPKEYNNKGLALFINGYCNLYKIANNNNNTFGNKRKLLKKIIYLSEILINRVNKNYSGACWGYNFDWQSRLLFLFPKNTPTVVATSYCVEALFHSYDITGNKRFKDFALSSANFVINDLKKTNHGSGFILSYSPLTGNNQVINASLLGSKILSLCYKYSKKEEYKIISKKIIKTCCELQNKDGSWIYGLLKTQNWIDSFHTAYNLEAISAFQEYTGDHDFKNNLNIGFKYYIRNFFLENGISKYYHDKVYPIDIHCPAQLFVTLYKLNKFKDYKNLSCNVLDWTITNMQSNKGYFYYQIRKIISSKISYMRWSNAFMFNAMTYFLLDSENL